MSLKEAESATTLRIVSKLTGEKQRQFQYAAELGKACVLALFDYTTWSGYDTQFFRFLGNSLLGTELRFRNLAPEVSALVYLERKVSNGVIGVSCKRSAVYHNPLAVHHLPRGVFSCFNEFSLRPVLVEPNSKQDWMWLSDLAVANTR